MLLLLLVSVPLAAALSAPLLDRFLGRAAGWPLAAVLAALAAATAAQAPAVLGAGATLEYSRPWIPALGVHIALRMDGLAWLFCMLVFGIGALVLAYSARYFPPGRRGGFFPLMAGFAAAMAGLVLADDAVLLFVFWELTTVCSFLLIGLSGAAGARPAVRTFLLTALGGLALLTAVILLMVRTGTSRLSAILADPGWQQDPGFTAVIAVLVAVAVFTKSAQFPFHYWLPDAMAASTPVSAYLHAAAMVKAGIYVAMRFTAVFADTPVWNALLIAAGLTTALIGAVFALQSTDLKTLTAYSTVSQLGFLTAAIGVGTEQALIAAAVHTAAHALFKSALFMVVGIVDRQTGTRDIRRLGGLRTAMPGTAAVAVAAALSMAGIPPLLGFASKENLFAALLQAPGPGWLGPAAGAAAVAAAALTCSYAARFGYRVFFGPPGSAVRERAPREPSAAFLAPPALAAGAGLLLGAAVPVLNPLAGRAAADATGSGAEAHLALWHGLNPELGMSAAAVALGALLLRATSAGDALAGRRLFPVRGTGVFEALHARTIALGRRTGALTGSDAPAFHLAVPIAALAVFAGTAAALGLSSAAGEPAGADAAAARPLDWLLVAVIGAAVLGACSTASRLAALAMVGVAGFGTALWFLFLGTVDVALTQLLVEVLTVVVAVLVLRRLPRTFHAVRRLRTGAAAALAAAAGTAAGLAAYLLTGRRELSAAGAYFLDRAPEDTGGSNVVNTILVDYRALDTLGELTVLGVAGLVVIAVLDAAGIAGRSRARLYAPRHSPVWDARENTLIVRTVSAWLIPLLLLWSLYLLARGHGAPGGGFIAGLVGGAAFALAYLAAPSAAAARIRVAYPSITAAGIATAALCGLAGYLDGSFLRPLHAGIPLPGGEFHFTTALVFDVGVYFAVVGVVLTALDWLGTGRAERGPALPPPAALPPEAPPDLPEPPPRHGTAAPGEAPANATAGGAR